MKIRALQNQSIFDLAVQHYGNACCAVDLAAANGLPVTAQLAAGQELEGVFEFRFSEPNKAVMDYYSARAIKPATATPLPSMRIFDDSFDKSFE